MRKKGFTLIELLVSLAIISLLVGALSLLFSFNFNILNSSYKEEREYKQASFAAMYIEEKIRRAQKISEIESLDSCNFILFVDGMKVNSTYSQIRFSLEKREGEDENYKVLYAYIDNNDNPSDKEGKVKIAILRDIFMYYDKESQTIEIVINNSSPKSRIKTFINLEDRL